MEETKILIVEDEFIVANDIRNSLHSMGYVVTGIAASGEKAIRKAELEKPALVLMDIMLRGEMNGIEAAKQIHSQFNIPVVFLTAYADPRIIEQAKEAEIGALTGLLEQARQGDLDGDGDTDADDLASFAGHFGR